MLDTLDDYTDDPDVIDGRDFRPPKPGIGYVLALDIGQSVDPTAIAVGEIVIGKRPIVRIIYLERILDMPYPNQVVHVGKLLSRREMRRAEFVLDNTGVGRPIGDMFRDAKRNPTCVTITSGSEVADNGGGRWSVPKVTLISGLQAMLHDNRFFIQSEIIDAAALVSELQSFEGHATDTGRWKFGARSGAHDDLVLACALVVWRADKARGPISGDGGLRAIASMPPRDRFARAR
jgi:hypothetical protein